VHPDSLQHSEQEQMHEREKEMLCAS
jgi:hypothetical protein